MPMVPLRSGLHAFRFHAARSHYQGRGLPSRKNPPVGPASSSKAAQTTLAAASATERVRVADPLSKVEVNPGHTVLMSNRRDSSCLANLIVSALSAAFAAA